MDVRRRISYNMNTGSGESTTTGTYTINLNNQWQKSSTITNPDATLYDGVYESFSNKGVNNTAATMTITINGYSKFTLYIRSYAESNWDYVMVSNLDQTIDNNTSYSNTTLVKAHTRGNQQSGTAVSNYTEVIFDNIDGNEHVITIVYRKDGSSHSSDDRGYLLIQGKDSSGDATGSINIENYLTILALENELTASLSANACQYCIDGDGNWMDLPADTTTQSIDKGQTLSFRGELQNISGGGIGTFTINRTCNLDGNCMSMLFSDNAVNNSSLPRNTCFARLFQNCINIIEVTENFLPATTLTKNCYEQMFEGCTNLISAPNLPANTLMYDCYNSMFSKCESLRVAPNLNATSLADYCYSYMFANCSNLVNPPVLPATKLSNNCYQSMFQNCVSLTTAPNLPAKYANSSCYSSMFSGCIKLSEAPDLPATSLRTNAYSSMFSGCTSLIRTPNLPATSLDTSSYAWMFYNCTNLIYASDLPATQVPTQAYNGMFQGCTSLQSPPNIAATILRTVSNVGNNMASMFNGCTALTTAPVLHSKTLVSNCYGRMFYNCTKLSHIEMLATDISANVCLDNWVSGVASTGTFVKDPSMTTLPTGSSGIPTGWTVVDNES